MAGDGPLRSMVESYCRRAPWDRTLVPVGVRKDREAFFKSLDLLLLPSLQEGLPTVLLEAACAGVPVAASRIPGVTDLFEEGRDAVLFEAGSSEDLARVTAELSHDAGLRKRLAASAQRLVLENVPSYAEVAGEHARLYREHLAKRGAAAVLTG
jgi:glycosyltransferase involved in cell wall biosynthesis